MCHNSMAQPSNYWVKRIYYQKYDLPYALYFFVLVARTRLHMNIKAIINNSRILLLYSTFSSFLRRCIKFIVSPTSYVALT